MSITAGEGHNSVAKAMKSYFESRDIQSDVLDTYRFISKELAACVSKGYLFVSSKMKRPYEMAYRMAERRHGSSYSLSNARILNHIFINEINEFIKDYSPDVIVFTHPFVGIILDLLKQKKDLHLQTVGVLTDFAFHPFWEECLRNDYVVIPCEALTYQGIKKGFSKNQLKPFGIPINPSFSKNISHDDACLQLGLDPQKKTILLMGGSMGYGKMANAVAELDTLKTDVDFQIISVCGNNKAMKKAIDKLTTSHTVLNLGFVDYVDLLMSAADCIVSKPGGITTSEAFAKNLPMIVVNPIPGQEKRNTDFLLNSGAAMTTTTNCSLSELIYQIFSTPERLESMKQAIASVAKPSSTEDACEFVISLAMEQEKAGELQVLEV